MMDTPMAVSWLARQSVSQKVAILLLARPGGGKRSETDEARVMVKLSDHRLTVPSFYKYYQGLDS